MVPSRQPHNKKRPFPDISREEAASTARPAVGPLRMMLIFQGGILPAGVGTASDDLDHLPVAGRHRAVPYARLDELAPCAMCRAKHNTTPNSASSNHFRFSARPTTCNPRRCSPVVACCVTIEREPGLNNTYRPGVSSGLLAGKHLDAYTVDAPHAERFVLTCSSSLVSVTIRRAPRDQSDGASGRRHHGND
jgi:hypothetical protein